MTVKTVEDLGRDLDVVKEDLAETKVKMSELLLLCKKLTKKFAIDDTLIKCDECESEFETYNDLRVHRKSHVVNTEKFRCEECGCDFLEKWKLNAHMKTHVKDNKYCCHDCGKTFKSEEIKTKHAKVTHESVKLFCHFYNNRIACPYDNKCVFLHEDAPLCRYGGSCERINCMFKHIVIEYASIDDEDSDDEDTDNENDEDEDTGSEENDDNVSDDKSDVNDLDTIAVAGKLETVELKVFVPCRDQWLSKDQTYYTEELRKFSEIESIEKLWIISKNNYEVGTYLETNLKFLTRFADRFKKDVAYRQSVWDRLGIKDTCPDQGE